MTIAVSRLSELDRTAWQQWDDDYQQRASTLSPFHAPHLYRLAAAEWPTLHAAVVGDTGHSSASPMVFDLVGRHGRPPLSTANGSLVDHQMWLCGGDGENIDPQLVRRAARLRSLRLDHVDGKAYAGAATNRGAASPIVGLRGGFDAYLEGRAANGSDLPAWIRRKRRAIERAVGPLRFVADDADNDTMRSLMNWKSEHYRRTGVADITALDSVRAVFEGVVAAPASATFAGPLSALYAGDSLVAAHLGLRSAGVWHWWLPSFDTTFREFSPGSLLLVELIRHAADANFRHLDLGHGDEPYKQRFATSSIPLVDINVADAQWKRATRRVIRRIQRVALRARS